MLDAQAKGATWAHCTAKEKRHICVTVRSLCLASTARSHGRGASSGVRRVHVLTSKHVPRGDETERKTAIIGLEHRRDRRLRKRGCKCPAVYCNNDRPFCKN